MVRFLSEGRHRCRPSDRCAPSHEQRVAQQHATEEKPAHARPQRQRAEQQSNPARQEPDVQDASVTVTKLAAGAILVSVRVKTRKGFGLNLQLEVPEEGPIVVS